jgi:predicted ArsR family transcriptional regulator
LLAVLEAVRDLQDHPPVPGVPVLPATVTTIAWRLGISYRLVRRQLATLKAQGIVAGEPIRKPWPGRPRIRWYPVPPAERRNA